MRGLRTIRLSEFESNKRDLLMKEIGGGGVILILQNSLKGRLNFSVQLSRTSMRV